MAYSADAEVRPIRLAEEPPFSLGHLRFEPATRQVLIEGQRQTLEPRVMQVIVALVRADGAVVGRDRLIQQCWDGRIVGDNAINRVISIARQLAAASGGAFELKTITKVGYRIVASRTEPEPPVAEASPETGQPPIPAAADRRSMPRRALLSAGVILGVGTAAGGAWLLRPRRPALSPEASALIEKGRDAIDTDMAGLPQQAIAYMQRATEVAPDSAEAWGALALAYASTYHFDDARQLESAVRWTADAARRARALDPDNADAAAALAIVRPSFRRWAAYERDCQEVLRSHPDHPRVLLMLGACLGVVGRWEDAVRVLGHAASVAPLRPDPQLALAAAQWQSGRLAEAEHNFESQAKLWPTSIYVQNVRFNFQVLNGKVGEAIAIASDVAARAPGQPMIPAELGIAAARAIATQAPADRALALAQVREAIGRHDIATPPALAYLVALGASNDAWRLLGTLLLRGAAAVGAGLPADLADPAPNGPAVRRPGAPPPRRSALSHPHPRARPGRLLAHHGHAARLSPPRLTRGNQGNITFP